MQRLPALRHLGSPAVPPQRAEQLFTGFNMCRKGEGSGTVENMSKRPEKPAAESPPDQGGRAAERLRQFLAAREPRNSAPSEGDGDEDAVPSAQAEGANDDRPVTDDGSSPHQGNSGSPDTGGG